MRPTLARHFEGWQLGLLAVAMASCALWLALPRPVEPDVLPLPEVNRRTLARTLALEAGLTETSAKEPLPFEVRAVGEVVRRYGLAAKAGDAGAARQSRSEVGVLVTSALKRFGSAPLRRLRALQTALFMDSVRRWQSSGSVDRELAELGGDFADKCRTAGWLDATGALALSEPELVVQFRMRWTELTGRLDDPDFRPSLDEFRLYYRTLLERPAGSEADVTERRLSIVAKLARIDSEFPGALATGVLLARLGRSEAARSAFQAHLSERPDGPWALRAKNYLLALGAPSAE